MSRKSDRTFYVIFGGVITVVTFFGFISSLMFAMMSVEQLSGVIIGDTLIDKFVKGTLNNGFVLTNSILIGASFILLMPYILLTIGRFKPIADLEDERQRYIKMRKELEDVKAILIDKMSKL